MLPQAENSWTISEAAHLINRAGFGGSPAEITTLHSLGREKAVDSLVTPTELLDAFPPLPWTCDEQVQADLRLVLEQRAAVRKAKRELTPEAAEELRREVGKKIRMENRRRTREAQDAWFRRMLTTQAPLREKMTLFWHDHFASSIQKVKQPVLMFRQNEMFRRGAFGSFKDLTQQILLDPAMAVFLDIQSSKKDQPNENFARELMELFTLGEGHYTEQDIREAARAFTGYQFKLESGYVIHNKRQWDATDKTIFGKTGPFNGQDVIELIFQKKQTARFMVQKLWEFFVADKPSTTTIDSLAANFLKHEFRTGPVLREIFMSQEFYAAANLCSLIKSPLHYLIALLKQLEISTPPVGFPIIAQQQLGQVLFSPPNVAGWDWGQAWITTNTLLARYNIAGVLTKATEDSRPKQSRSWVGPDYEHLAPRPLRENPEDLVQSLILRFFQSPLPSKAQDTFTEYAIAKKGAIFTNKETAELCHLMLSTPQYQLY
jgi:uncharacterized protein (DUF1800 family)